MKGSVWRALPGVWLERVLGWLSKKMLGYMCISEPYIRTAYYAYVSVGVEEGQKKKNTRLPLAITENLPPEG